MTKWQKWYAWHPVSVNGRFVWLKEIYRKYQPGYRDAGPYYLYTDSIFDVIKDI